jgi:hypothetical protein
LPAPENDILTLSHRDGDQKITKNFSRHSVPSEVHEILITMGFGDRQFKGLNFVSKAVEPDAAREAPSAAAVRESSETMNPKPESEAPAAGGGR